MLKKLVSWNVNGLRACLDKGFMEYFNEVGADIFVFKTKLQEGKIDFDADGYHQYFNYAEKGLFGNSCFSKENLSMQYGMGMEKHDKEAHNNQEFDEFYLMTYIPNAKELARLDYRMEWDDCFEAT